MVSVADLKHGPYVIAWLHASLRLMTWTSRERGGAYENASTEKSSTTVQGWEMQVRKKQVQMWKDGKCKYGKK